MFRSLNRETPESGQLVDDRHAAARAWFASAAGQRVLEAEATVVRQQLAYRFGYHLVQVGDLPGFDVLSASRTLQRSCVTLDGSAHVAAIAAVRGRAADLPVESDSVDVVVLPHVLEFESRPHEALREAARVLVPEGHLVMCGLNPLGLLGLWRALLKRSRRAPWNGRFLSQGRVRDWLELVGLELTACHGVFFRPPLHNDRVMQRLLPMESLGRHIWPAFGGAYVLEARKRVSRATPIRPQLTYQPRLVGVGLAGGPPARVKAGSPPARVRDAD